MTPRMLDCGDTAVTVEFGNLISPALLAAVNALDAAILRRRDDPALAGIVETVPTFRSLTVIYDPLATSREILESALARLLEESGDAAPREGRHWRLPVCYGGEHGPDLEHVAAASGLAVDELCACHAGAEYAVYMLGFLPGFPFMGELPPSLQLPRRSEPRVRVPAGSVAIATGLTAIYPWESPGGWHLLGRCPAPLFDASRAAPALLAAGDRVSFEPIDEATFVSLSADCEAGRIDPQRWCITGAERS